MKYTYTVEVEDEKIRDLTESLNDDGHRWQYSERQVEKAVCRLLDIKFDDIVTDIEDYFDEHLHKISLAQRDRFLGDPELDMKEEAYYAAGDAKFDAMRDAQGE